MELIKLELTSETNTHFLFTLTMEYKNFWGKKKQKKYDCIREKNALQSRFISSGDTLFHEWLNIDSSINAILSLDNKEYSKKY